MQLLRLEAYRFRNLSGEIEFAPGLNILYGPNAQGKSNWLEAVYLLATTKSFRTSHPRETLLYGEQDALLRGAVIEGNLTRELQLLLAETAKQTFVNGKREAVTRYLGVLDAVAFTAEELEVVRGGPEARRRFLDRGLVATMPAYLGTLAEYNRILKQKNRLLRDAADAADPNRFIPQIESWNDQLVRLGAEIHSARTGYVDRLRQALTPQLFGVETVDIRYRSALEHRGDLSDYAALFTERLALRLRNEMASGYSLVGPHRDDLEILGDGREIARFGSSGQQRSALLLLDLAQINVYNQAFSEYPVFLIDDIDAELDRTRIETLLNHLEGKTQTIVSTSKRALAERYGARAALRPIAGGRVVASATLELRDKAIDDEKNRGKNDDKNDDKNKDEIGAVGETGETDAVRAEAAESGDEEARHRAPF
ncbi:MAG: DNA replication and repair protein RecF [Blastocatellales bacterium]|nr:DNA replication and repair protein RecF [Blastocatellales bacterium]